MEKLKQNPIVKKLGLNRIMLVCILVLMFVVFKVVLGSKFPVGDSIKSTLNYVYFLGFLSLGVTFVIATGGIDFSIGPVMFCCALVSGYCMTSYGVPCAAAMVLCVLIGLAFGIFNGWLVSYMSVPPFIVSMASMNIAKGIASVFTKTQSVSWPQSSDPVNGWFRNIASYNGFPVGLADVLDYSSKERMEETLKNTTKVFKDSLAVAIQSRLKGKTPEGLGGAASAENLLRDQIARNVRGL